jgi:hypothetical protein
MKKGGLIKQNNKCTNSECNNKCNHQFVKDLIDINPDYSKEITYCTLCGYTKK